MSEWISVKERLPEFGDKVLLGKGINTSTGHRVFVNNGIGWSWNGIADGVDPRPTWSHWMPIQPPPPPPEPRLTVNEALREAVYQLELIHKMGRRHYGERLTDRGGYYIGVTYMKDSADALPRLRAALEAE